MKNVSGTIGGGTGVFVFGGLGSSAAVTARTGSATVISLQGVGGSVTAWLGDASVIGLRQPVSASVIAAGTAFVASGTDVTGSVIGGHEVTVFAAGVVSGNLSSITGSVTAVSLQGISGSVEAPQGNALLVAVNGDVSGVLHVSGSLVVIGTLSSTDVQAAAVGTIAVPSALGTTILVGWYTLMEGVQEGISVFNQVVLGSFGEDLNAQLGLPETTMKGHAGAIAFGFTGFDLYKDVLDLMHDVANFKGSGWDYAAVTMDVVGFLPLAGVVKNVGNALVPAFKYGADALKAIDNVIHVGVNVGDIGQGAKALVRNAGAAFSTLYMAGVNAWSNAGEYLVDMGRRNLKAPDLKKYSDDIWSAPDFL